MCHIQIWPLLILFYCVPQTIWQRPGGGDFTAAAVSVFGSSVFSQLKLHYHGSSASPATNEDGLQ